ncbi:hypothetical protein [Algoriphagus sediminis]|uniref:hypothetical protein n=1 Tax=Algoriphagus sediminis TaxID=3057113 RepID=UPI0025B02E6E|nr:hypothetical protein [Algoriphagus sediminis]
MQDEKPQPNNSQEVIIVVDESLDFSNYEIHTLVDSISLNDPDEKLYAPEDYTSTVYAIDNESGEINAVGQYNPTTKTVNFGPETITESLLHLAPLYNSLTEQERLDFINRVKGDDSFMALLETVNIILSNKEPIYSERPEFTDQILAINDFIIQNYFSNNNPNDRVLNGDEAFSDFIKNDQGLAIYNEVSSYVSVKFKSLTDDNYTKKFILNPGPLTPIGKETIERPFINDDYYHVSIDQTDEEVYERNLDKAVNKFLGAIMSGIIGVNPAEGLKGCVSTISGELIKTFRTYVLESNNPSNEKILTDFISATVNVLKQSITDNGKCTSIFLNKRIISQAIVANANLIFKIYKAAKFAYDVSEASAYSFALFEKTQIKLDENLQKYRGNPIPAILEAVDVNSFESEYLPGDKVSVQVKMNAKSNYGEWEKSGYKVSWSVPPLNGELNALFSDTNEEGIATVLWTLPQQENAVVNLTAELKDQEGDHLYGSPMNFQVNITEKVDSLALYRQAAVGTWDVVASNGGSPVNYEYVIEMREDGSLFAKWWSLYENGERYNPCCPWTRVPKVQEIDGRYHLNFFLNLHAVQPTDPLTYPPTTVNHYHPNGTVSYACTKR